MHTHTQRYIYTHVQYNLHYDLAVINMLVFLQ